jgi:hypothetical protein
LNYHAIGFFPVKIAFWGGINKVKRFWANFKAQWGGASSGPPIINMLN